MTIEQTKTHTSIPKMLTPCPSLSGRPFGLSADCENPVRAVENNKEKGNSMRQMQSE
jgi:hypothetical protein